MPESRTFGATFETCRQVAEAALANPEGITVWFYARECGSLEEAKKRARSFQTVFAGLRSRARKMGRVGAVSLNPHADITEKPGPYDSLICQTHALPDNAGYSVGLYPGALLLNQLNITDNATGLPLSTVGRHRDERTKLFDILEKTNDQFTRENGARLFELDADLRADFNGDLNAFLQRFAPHTLRSVSTKGESAMPIDLADLDMSIDPFTGEEAEDDDA